MARILVVGEVPGLESAITARGHAVRVLEEPDSLGPLLPELHGVSALCWAAAPRLLPSLAAKLVDTHVRGFACGPDGAEVAELFARTYGMPTAVVRDGDWAGAVERLIT
ncbi:MAG: hypothetical protein M3340_06590 [Actinomycetota bacterium]|nr:hypothetical protein [Actinomycetota bacterium]